MMKLTSAQFDALAELLRLRDGSERAGVARLVFVDGASKDEAMAATGASRQNAEAAIRVFERGLALARQAGGGGDR